LGVGRHPAVFHKLAMDSSWTQFNRTCNKLANAPSSWH